MFQGIVDDSKAMTRNHYRAIPFGIAAGLFLSFLVAFI